MNRSLISQWLVVIVALASFGGCSSKTEVAQDIAKTDGPEPVRLAGNSYRAALTREALKGLKYDTGRVTVDNAWAPALLNESSTADAKALHESAKTAYRQGRLLDALKDLAKSVIIDPRQATTYETLGTTLLGKKKVDKAEAAFRTAIDLDPNYARAHEQLGLTLSGSSERFEEAIKHYSIAAELAPDNGHVYSRLAILNYYLNRPEQSRKYIQLATIHGYEVPRQLRGLLNGQLGPAESNAGGLPTVGAQIQVDANNPLPGNETTAASTDVNPNCVITGWNDYREGGGARSGFAISDDGGDTWNDFLLRPPVPFQSGTEGDPMTAYDNRTGNMWVGAISFGGSGGVYVARKNAGDNFLQPVVMAEITGGADKCWMAAGEDPNNANATRVYIGYNEGLLTSVDDGDSWSGPTGFPEFGLGWLPRVGPNGELYLAYWDASDGVKMLRSFDGGQTLEGPITIATRMDVWFVDGSRFPGRFRVAPICGFAVDPNDGTLYSVWFDTTSVSGGNSNVDIYFSRSIDQGDTWTTPTIINTDSATPGDQFFSWIEVDSTGRLHLIFYDTRSVIQDDNTTDSSAEPSAILEAYYSYSDDGGNTWSEIVLTPQSFDTAVDGFDGQFIGDYLGIAVAGTTVFPCYVSTQDGISNVYVHKVTNDFLLGDINGDGAVNLLDVNPFVELIANGKFDKAADINGDGAVNLLDVDGFVALLGG